MLETALAITSVACAVIGLQLTVLFKVIGLYERIAKIETTLEIVVKTNTLSAEGLDDLESRVTKLEEQFKNLLQRLAK